MGKDVIHKRCLGDNVRYADLLNGLLFGGRQEISPDDVQESDSQTSSAKARDIVKKVACGTNFAVIGVENQEKVHYAMPFRSMYYDAMEYDRQVRAIRKQVRGTRKGQEKQKAEGLETERITDAEYLSGFRKADKLLPCITLVLYYGDEWDGPRELADILELSDLPVELKRYVNNYPLHLFCVKEFTDEDTEVFRTDLKQIFDFIRYSGDKRRLWQLVENNPAYREMDEDAYDMVMEYTNSTELVAKKDLYRKGKKLDVCEGIRGMMEDERQAGIKQGIEQGIEQGMELAREEFIKIFILDNQESGTPRERVAEKLVRRFGMTAERAEEYLKKMNY